MALSDSQRYPWSLYMINNVEDTVVFIGLKLFTPDHSYVLLQYKYECQFWTETTIENN